MVAASLLPLHLLFKWRPVTEPLILVVHAVTGITGLSVRLQIKSWVKNSCGILLLWTFKEVAVILRYSFHCTIIMAKIIHINDIAISTESKCYHFCHFVLLLFLQPIYVMHSSRYNLWTYPWAESRKRKWRLISSFLATDSGWWWWWRWLWVGYSLDQDVGSRDDWVVQEGVLMRKHCLTYSQGGTFLSAHREPGGFFRKENSCKQVTRDRISFQNSDNKLRVHSLCPSSHGHGHVWDKSQFPVYMEVFPVQPLTPAGVSCFVRLMSHTGWRHSGVSLANCDWFGHYALI